MSLQISHVQVNIGQIGLKVPLNQVDEDFQFFQKVREALSNDLILQSVLLFDMFEEFLEVRILKDQFVQNGLMKFFARKLVGVALIDD